MQTLPGIQTILLTHKSTAHPSTVNNETLARDIVRSLGCEVDDGTLKVLRGTPAAGGDTLEDLARTVLVRNERLVHVGSNVSGSDSVHVDTLGSPAVRKGLDLREG